MRSESGFSFVEILIAISVSAMLTLGAGMTTAQIMTSSQRNSDWNTALRQAQSVGQWVSQDAIMVSDIGIGDDPGTTDTEFITLFWKDWENGDTYDTSYIWSPSEDSLQKLTRVQVVHDNNEVEISNTTRLVADNIYSATIISQGDSWKLNVETHSGKMSVTREYVISQRIQD